MIAIVLIGVMVDRQTFTFRTITVAAFGVLLLAPEAVVHPSFQMSFAATLALIAGYQQGLPWMSSGGDTPLAARIALWGGRELLGLTLVSLLAGTATIPFTAYHFHRVSPFGVIANLAAMPIVSAWVMPWGILGLLAMPFGMDGICWRMMWVGIDWMTGVALWVTSFPGAVGRIAAFGVGPLLLCTLGLVLFCLLKTPLRLIGAILIGCAVLVMLRTPQPDVLISADASAAAVRDTTARLPSFISAATHSHCANGLPPTAMPACQRMSPLPAALPAMMQAASQSSTAARWSRLSSGRMPSRRTAVARSW